VQRRALLPAGRGQRRGQLGNIRSPVREGNLRPEETNGHFLITQGHSLPAPRLGKQVKLAQLEVLIP